MREKAEVDDLTFALSADVTEAHRQVPIHPDDWHYLGCQVILGGDVLVNNVGTFGIASASYCWSRVAGAIGLLLQHLSGHSSTSWHMHVADDYLLESGGPGYRSGLLLFFVLCASVSVPLSWHKTCGGDTCLFRLRDPVAVDVCWYFDKAPLLAGSTPSKAGGRAFPSAFVFVFGIPLWYVSVFVYVFHRDFVYRGVRTCFPSAFVVFCLVPTL